MIKLNLNLLKFIVLALFFSACSTEDEFINIPQNDIRLVIISGTPQIGETLTAFYEITGFEPADYETATTAINWWRADDNLGTNATIIPNANTKFYSLTTNEIGKFITVKVTVENTSNGSRRSRYIGAIKQ